MEQIKRYNNKIENGLTNEQVEERKKEGLVNYDTSVPTKSIKRILFDNLFTIFNFLNLFFALAVLLVGSYKNMLFFLIVIINTTISTVQEINSKRIIDKLSVLASNKVKVIRNSKIEEISINELVLDDIVKYTTGNQICADSIIMKGNIQVNESSITGEPNSVDKKEGDMLLSGSYIISGNCTAKIEHIGDENYTSKISSGAKYVKKVNSEIMNSLNKIITFLAFAIIPIGIILFIRQMNIQNMTFNEAVVKSVAAIIGMIPEGLVLLTSTVLAVSVIRLSKFKVLVQELYCIETLARVDTLCLDKTGTLTEGIMDVKNYISIDENYEMNNILSNIAKASEDNNPTMVAIKRHFNKLKEEWKPINKVAFSSKKKWSGIEFEKKGAFIIGAPEVILKDQIKKYKNQIDELSENYRVLVLAHSKYSFENNDLPAEVYPIGYILILDKIRKEAKDTIEYFYKQNVDIKIISGDNPVTISKIAKHTGIKEFNKYIDMTQVSTYDEIKKIVAEYTIFGRVSPVQKEQIIKALQEKGRTVAMTGDGVNDVLALKASDCSIAMANGSDATKSVAQLILLDSNFASMPKVVAEGRRTINNIQRSASLFLVKTIYSTLLALMFLAVGSRYPFEPIQLSLISLVTIGIPSFILALEPNREKIQGDFLKNIILRAVPTGLAVVINILAITVAHKMCNITNETFSSLCVISTGICGIILLFTLTRKNKNEKSILPFSIFRMSLAIVLTIIFIAGLTVLNWWFNIAPIKLMYNKIFKVMIISLLNFVVLTIFMKKILKI